MGNSSLNRTSKVVAFAALSSFGIAGVSSVCAPVYAATNSSVSVVAAGIPGLSSNLSDIQIAAAVTTSSAPGKSTASHGGLLGSIAHSIGFAIGHIASGIGHATTGIIRGIGHATTGIIRGTGKVAAGVGSIVGGVAAGVGSIVGGVAAGIGSIVGGVAAGIGHTIFKAVSAIPSITFHIPAIVVGAVSGGIQGFVNQFLPTSATDFNGMIPPIIRNAQAGVTFFSQLLGDIGTVIPVLGNAIGTVAGTVIGVVVGAGLPLITAPIAGAIHGATAAIGSAVIGSHHHVADRSFSEAILIPKTVAPEVQKVAGTTTAPQVSLLG